MLSKEDSERVTAAMTAAFESRFASIVARSREAIREGTLGGVAVSELTDWQLAQYLSRGTWETPKARTR